MICPKCKKNKEKDVNLDVNEKEHQFCPECGWENPDVQVGLWYQRMKGFGQAGLLSEPQLKKLLDVFKKSYPDVLLKWVNDNAEAFGSGDKVVWSE